MDTLVFYSTNAITLMFGEAAPGSAEDVSLQAQVRDPANYRHVTTCLQGTREDIIGVLWGENRHPPLLAKRFHVRSLEIGDIMVSHDGVGVLAPTGFVQLEDVNLEAFLAKARNVPTFSVLPEEVPLLATEAA